MTVGVYFQPGLNYYVPQMQASPGVGEDGLYSVSLGRPVATSGNVVLAAGTISNATKTFNATSNPTQLPYTIDAVYGRSISLTGGTAGDNAAVTVQGTDYLGQPVAETITLAGVGVVNSNKTFKRINAVVIPAGNANASSTINVGVGGKLGLPFKTDYVMAEFSGDILAAAGALVQPNVVDPQTGTTADPRGQYTPATTLNGTNEVNITARASRLANSSNNGGLHGLRHYYA